MIGVHSNKCGVQTEAEGRHPNRYDAGSRLLNNLEILGFIRYRSDAEGR